MAKEFSLYCNKEQLKAILYALRTNTLPYLPPEHYQVKRMVEELLQRDAETFYDAETKLTWQVNPPHDRFTYREAEVYAASLELCGLSWRLPTIEELKSQISFDLPIPLGFDSEIYAFWSSSVSPGPGLYIYCLDVIERREVLLAHEDCRRFVRCVALL